MSMQELAKQQYLKRVKVMSHFGVLDKYNDLWKRVDERREKMHSTDDPIAMYMMSHAEGMEDFADAIISKTPEDWD